MAAVKPYTFIQCPCSDPSTLARPADASSAPDSEIDDDHDDHPFDPRAPRSNYSLYPIEYLLYCEDCHQIRCQRCVAEEIATYYCANCLFEVPSSNIKSEGNRCTRSCFQCPICIGNLQVTALETKPNPGLLGAESVASISGPWVLTCAYCQWTSTEIGIKFDKPNGICAQLQKIRNGGKLRLGPKERRERRKDSTHTSALGASAMVAPSPPPPPPTTGATAADASGPASGIAPDLDIETQFANLRQFYQAQLSESSGTSVSASMLGEIGFSSPGSLSRIMSLYTTGSFHDTKKAKQRITAMREALDTDEGLKLSDLDDSAAIAQLRQEGWHGTASATQADAQPVNTGEPDLQGAARFLSSLRPVACLLRTKRSKRCPICRHIISKPEPKLNSTRFRIRLVAGSYIPSITIRPLLDGPAAASAASATPELLKPLKPLQYLLTFKNPIFETVKVSLATPATTPGRFASTVTVLCPQFEIGANTDVWDEALKDGGEKERRRRGTGGLLFQPEAGKPWERGRNWVSIVVEVIPASLNLKALAATKMKISEGEEEVDLSPLREDEDLLEIPMFVRVEWEADPTNDDVGAAPGAKDKEAKEKRELAYWSVLGIGRISQA